MTVLMYRILGTLLAVSLTLITLAACAAPSGPTAAQPRPTIPSTQPTIPPTIPPAQPQPKETPVSSQPGMEKPVLAGTNWQLIELAGKPVIQSPKPITAEFNSEGRVAGSAGCNQYGAGYTVTGGQVSIAQAISTKMACMQPGVMEQEAAFLNTLSQVTTFKLDGDRLTLSTANGPSLVFTKS